MVTTRSRQPRASPEPAPPAKRRAPLEKRRTPLRERNCAPAATGKLKPAADPLAENTPPAAAEKTRAGRKARTSPPTPQTAKTTQELAAAQKRLHVAAVPETLPCREEEFAHIYSIVQGALEEQRGECVYISGVPGTGKTATVLEAMRALQRDAAAGHVPAFRFVELNGMKLTDPAHAYVALWQGVSGTAGRLTPAHAQAELAARFGGSGARVEKGPMVVALVDELDVLVTRKQTVMYNLFDWPNRPRARLIVVAVANTMDLPERLLSNRVASRLGLTRINFAPYTHEQLTEIVLSRLRGLDAFERDAVVFCARKVAAVTGDARRALDICRRAAELAAAAGQRVSMATVGRAIRDLSATPAVRVIQAGSRLQRLALWALVRAIQATGTGEATFRNLAAQFRTPLFHNLLQQLAGAATQIAASPQALLLVLRPQGDQGAAHALLCAQTLKRLVAHWAANRCILTTPAHDDLDLRLRLNVSEDEVLMALRTGPDDLVRQLAVRQA